MVEVFLEGKPVGTAVPFVISTHTHPQVPTAPPAAGATGIDYLSLVLAASEDATPGAIHYRQLAGDGEGDIDESGANP